MKFSHAKTIPRQPNTKIPSQNNLSKLKDPNNSEKKAKSSSVLVIKKPITQQIPKPFQKSQMKALINGEEETKNEVLPGKTGLFTTKPSTKYTNIKTIDPFADTSKSKL